MSDDPNVLKKLVAANPYYPEDAYKMVFEGIRFFVEDTKTKRHLSAIEIYEAMAYASVNIWGYLAGMVVESFNIRTSKDVKYLIETLIKAELLYKGEDDKMEDFDKVTVTFQDLTTQIFDNCMAQNPPSLIMKDEE